jgi:hypothetical protein
MKQEWTETRSNLHPGLDHPPGIARVYKAMLLSYHQSFSEGQQWRSKALGEIGPYSQPIPKGASNW